MILVIGQRADPHVVSVAEALDLSDTPYIVMDVFEARGDGLTHSICGNARISVGRQFFPLADVRAIWWRQKPRFVYPTNTAAALYDYNFIHREWNYLINFIAYETKHVFSINNREKAAVADNKMFQLQLAEQIGFSVPRTLISNNPESVLAFIKECQSSKYVFKTFTPYMSPDGLLTYTTIIDRDQIVGNAASIRIAPGIFQEFVDKDFELRITVVGERLFSARVASGASIAGNVDWRADQFADIFSVYTPDEEFSLRLLKLHRELGLFYAAYDFIVTRTGKVVFLEVNPAGQWMWLEHRLGFMVGKEIADALAVADRKPAGP